MQEDRTLSLHFLFFTILTIACRVTNRIGLRAEVQLRGLLNPIGKGFSPVGGSARSEEHTKLVVKGP